MIASFNFVLPSCCFRFVDFVEKSASQHTPWLVRGGDSELWQDFMRVSMVKITGITFHS